MMSYIIPITITAFSALCGFYLSKSIYNSKTVVTFEVDILEETYLYDYHGSNPIKVGTKCTINGVNVEIVDIYVEIDNKTTKIQAHAMPINKVTNMRQHGQWKKFNTDKLVSPEVLDNDNEI